MTKNKKTKGQKYNASSISKSFLNNKIMSIKYILPLFAFCCGSLFLNAQVTVTDDYLWINEFHYDNMTSRGNSDDGEFVELIIHDDILADADALAKLKLVLYTGGGVGMDETSPIGKGLPYHIASKIYSESDAVHPLNESDALGITGWQICDILDKNYAVMSKQIPGIQDLSAGFALIYDDKTLVQLLSYEKQFRVSSLESAGPAADELTELIASSAGTPQTESSLTTMANHSIYKTGTGNKDDDFVWSDPITNLPTPCAVNSAQTLEDLACLPPSIENPGDQTVCGTTYILPEIKGEFLSGTQAYYNDSQANGGTPITQVMSDMEVFIYDDNGSCDNEKSFMVSFAGAVSIDPISDATGCGAYILPTITGTALSGSEAYYTGQDGTGTSFLAGDEITTSQTLYAYDNNGQCDAEQAIIIMINDMPTIMDIMNQNACDAFVLPDISGSNLSGFEAYYSEPNGGGTSYAEGASLTESGTYYIYDSGAGCAVEQSFAINIIPTPVIDSPMGTLEGCNELILPNIEGSDVSANRTYYTMPDGEGDEIVIGTLITESATLYAYDEVSGCKTSQEFMVNINAFVPGRAGENQTITEGDDVAPFEVIEAASGNGTFEFQWQSSPDNAVFSNIDGAIMETYDEGVLTESTYYRRNSTMTTSSNVICEDEGARLFVEVEEVVLAVELLSFRGTAKDKQTLLQWETAQEVDAAAYHIEWGLDGKEFTEIGVVTARNEASAYEFVHQNPAANRNYYRLRQVDLNDKFTYSPIVSVNFNLDFNETISFYPNPSKGKVAVTISDRYDTVEKITVEVFDVKGQLLLNTLLLNNNELDLSTLPTGTYQVRLVQGDIQQLGQVIIE